MAIDSEAANYPTSRLKSNRGWELTAAGTTAQHCGAFSRAGRIERMDDFEDDPRECHRELAKLTPLFQCQCGKMLAAGELDRDPKWPEPGWQKTLADVAYEDGWLVDYEGDDFTVACPKCRASPKP